MERSQALEVIHEHVKNKNLVKHMLATEAVMKALASRLGEDEKRWGLAGLLHDIDYDETGGDPERHSLIGAEILQELGVEPDIVYAVKAHNAHHGLPRTSKLDRALYAADPVTGLIVAAALVHPEKALAAIDVPFIMHRFKQPSFARGANREQICSCSELGLELEEFIGIALAGMQNVAGDLGLQ